MQELINSGEVTQVELTDDVRARLVVVRSARVLQHAPDLPGGVRAQRVVIEAATVSRSAAAAAAGCSAPPALGAGRAGRPPAAHRRWPGPAGRRRRPTLTAVDLPGTVDSTQWRLDRRGPRADRPVIGRHCRGGRAEWRRLRETAGHRPGRRPAARRGRHRRPVVRPVRRAPQLAGLRAGRREPAVVPLPGRLLSAPAAGRRRRPTRTRTCWPRWPPAAWCCCPTGMPPRSATRPSTARPRRCRTRSARCTGPGGAARAERPRPGVRPPAPQPRAVRGTGRPAGNPRVTGPHPGDPSTGPGDADLKGRKTADGRPPPASRGNVPLHPRPATPPSPAAGSRCLSAQGGPGAHKLLCSNSFARHSTTLSMLSEVVVF